MEIKTILDEMGLRYEVDGGTIYVEPRWRITTDVGANIWGTWNTEAEADEAYEHARRLGLPNILRSFMSLGIESQDDGGYLLFDGDDGMPILSGDIGDGRTLQYLIQRYTVTGSIRDFAVWAGRYASTACNDTSIINH